MEWVEALANTPMPTILVIAGLFFLFLAVAGGISGKIQVPPNRQMQSAVTGGLLIALGLLIYVSGSVERESPEPIVEIAGGANGQASGSDLQRDISDESEVEDYDASQSATGNLDVWPVKYDPDYFRSSEMWPDRYEEENEHGWFRRRYFNGEPVIAVTGKDRESWIYTRIPIQPLRDFEVRADFSWDYSDNGAACVGYRFRDVGSSYYLYLACSNGIASFWEYVEDREEQWKKYRSVQLYDLVDPDANAVGVRALDDVMYLIVNNQVVLELEDGRPQAGNISLHIESRDQAVVEVLVQDLTLYVPGA